MIDSERLSFDQGDYNVILVDWRKGAQVPLFMYENSASNIRVVSAYLAKLMDMVAAETGYDMSKTHCIGHSLGAQTCGFFGKRVSNTLGRITGESFENLREENSNLGDCYLCFMVLFSSNFV